MKTLRTLLISALALLAAACGTTNTVPITGRKTRLLVDDAQILSLSTQQYQDYMKSAKLSTNQTGTAMVKRVGQRLATAVESFLKNNGYEGELQNFQWEFNLVSSNEVNAFCMPGGKIVVYEGLLPVTQDEASLAIVLGHEIAHAVAKHSAEQLSKKTRQQYATQIGGSVLSSVAQTKGLGDAVSLIEMAAQVGFNFANLKYSRDNETEADRLGLIFAAMAGYDPQLAIPFWQRMAQQSGGSSKSEIFSDHPSDEKRIAELQKRMPEALQYYTPPTQTTTTTSAKKKATTTKKK
ncbi:MAG: M48 family metallopeptidase [Bacteroidaceae bacterium]|nr:M48 family metallopeptidase [Bacteroidaceae bacterium]MBQ9295539.1 M48 family metallopeptidase [Bacteroidaceae bacterium]